MKEMQVGMSPQLVPGQFRIAREKLNEFEPNSSVGNEWVEVETIFQGNMDDVADVLFSRAVHTVVVSPSKDKYYFIYSKEDYEAKYGKE